ncbi:hypothetical protein EVAR_817_1 [Eumeta japonica]|uniref:Uncharacterized protein n=1 Tax=Eumeta variegata TaxID=151549 RepID=A0A4C1SCH4_EUMVA|nr:hypothetical protein EVAR_817_1 [Eumeta japonica]
MNSYNQVQQLLRGILEVSAQKYRKYACTQPPTVTTYVPYREWHGASGHFYNALNSAALNSLRMIYSASITLPDLSFVSAVFLFYALRRFLYSTVTTILCKRIPTIRNDSPPGGPTKQQEHTPPYARLEIGGGRAAAVHQT